VRKRWYLELVPLAFGVVSLSYGIYRYIQELPGTPADPPDILMFTLCSVRADHVHAYGYPGETTPNIDKFAASSTRYVNAFAAGTFTGSSHGALLTGLLPATNGLLSAGDNVSPTVPTLPGILHDFGYSTAAFMGARGPAVFADGDGLERGFDAVNNVFQDPAAMIDSAADWWHHAKHPAFAVIHIRNAHAPYANPPPTVDPRISAWRNGAFGPGVHDGNTTTLLADALEGDPQLHAELASIYDQGVQAADADLGSALAKIDPDMKRTVVVLAADHGEALGEDGHLGHMRYNDPAVVHVPLLVHYPDGLGDAEPDVVQTEVSLLDVLPTLLTLAKVPPLGVQDGRSLLGLGTVPVWTASNGNTGARPAIAQANRGSILASTGVSSVVTTQDWRLTNDGAIPMFQHRVVEQAADGRHERWVSADDPATLTALLKFYTEHAPIPSPASKTLSPETVNALRKAGYW
jgi:arylsulfatase